MPTTIKTKRFIFSRLNLKNRREVASNLGAHCQYRSSLHSNSPIPQRPAKPRRREYPRLAAPPQPDKMTKEELLPLLANPDVTVIDLRFGRDWYDSDIKIKGAVRENPMQMNEWMNKYPKDKTIVFYCA